MPRLNKFPLEDIENNTKLYDIYHNEYEMEDGWDEGNKEENFSIMLKLAEYAEVPFKHTACLDIGCGSGDFSVWLRDKGVKRYLGIDIYKASLQKAWEKYPQEEFIQGDFLAGAINEMFDYAFCSGALTVKVSVDNYDFLESIVAKMWELTRVGLVFNVLTDDDMFPDKDLFFYNPQKVADICEGIAPGAALIIEKTPHKAQAHFFMYR